MFALWRKLNARMQSSGYAIVQDRGKATASVAYVLQLFYQPAVASCLECHSSANRLLHVCSKPGPSFRLIDIKQNCPNQRQYQITGRLSQVIELVCFSITLLQLCANTGI